MRMIRLMTFALLAIGLAGCNTVAGLGKDIERGGAAIQRWSHR